MIVESIESLRETEADCLSRFRTKAKAIQAANPSLSPQICFARAVEALPKSAERYQYVRSRLQFTGIPALPLR